MQVPLLDLKAQYSKIKSEVLPAIEQVCDSQWVCLGPAVEAFESAIATYCDCSYALGVSSGSDALLAGLMALDIGPGDEVITSPFTFFATAGAISRVGARPVFVDVDLQSYNIDPDKIEEKITEKTKAIIPVHLFGQCAPMKPILALAKKYHIRVVEDAAQAIGATQEGAKAGSMGDLGCFSFYPTKNLGAFGDAGLITTNDQSLAEKLKILRDHGQYPRYHYHMVGGNFRLDAIQGAVLSIKLKYIDQWNQARREHAALYDQRLADSEVTIPAVHEKNTSVYHQYTIRAPQRDTLKQYLTEQGIGTAVFYPKPLHLQDCFRDLGYQEGDFPIAERLCQEVLSLPIYTELTAEQIDYVADTIRSFYKA
jgi:dTDP-4-amino-4,6-dideoxygalactose transaminase